MTTSHSRSVLARLAPATASVRAAGGGTDAGAAMVLVLVVMLLGASLAVLALAAVTQQVRPTLVERKYVRALHASDSGLQVALGQIQGATQADPLVPGAVIGDRAQLPCQVGDQRLTGAVGGEPGDLTYSVRIRYYAQDPGPQTATWRDSAANVMTCPLTAQPGYALLQSTGDSASGAVGASVADRTTEVVYRFRTDTTNAAGGTISSGSLCWDAGASPSASSTIRLKTCVSNAAQQQFWWRDDNTIVLASSVGGTPLCVTADRPGNSTTSTQPASLAECDGLLHQSWGVDDGAGLYGYPSGTSGGWRLCGGSGVVFAQSGCSTVFTYAQSVGTGRAGSVSASQPGRVIHWVNYQVFGRCLDVNSWSIANDLILYPCKQDPLKAGLRWNQGWYYGIPDADGRSEISTYAGKVNEDYSVAAARAGVPRVCLSGAFATGTALRLLPCTGGVEQRVVVNREVTVDGAVDYGRSYTIVDSTGRCLDSGPATAASPGNLGTKGLSSVRWSLCSGAASQKWNAPPTFTSATQSDFREDS
ncbi:RICIN domain-containing protein [Pseudokineococcus sp. 1T1Z-3]|uniref:RICIN domain-containing protein n=1 Tax=Pseudokineococcus sp. 1T1Z-3 TaxID=3132745 RepID=UPI00309B69E3